MRAAGTPLSALRLAAPPGVDEVAFTGFTDVGRLIVRGKSPNAVFDDAEVKAVTTRL